MNTTRALDGEFIFCEDLIELPAYAVVNLADKAKSYAYVSALIIALEAEGYVIRKRQEPQVIGLRQ